MDIKLSTRLTALAYSVLGDRLSADVRSWYHRRDPRFRASVARALSYKDKHRGQRCFIIGNGPSLKDTDLSLLENEVTFGLNRIYLLFDELGFAITYYLSINALVIEQCAADMLRLPCPKFIGWHARDLIDFTDGMVFLRIVGTPGFYTDITSGIWDGATVTYVAIQVAYYMGFDEVILIGVDHSFATKGTPHKTVVSQGDDLNHFHPEYFGKGFRWQLPDLETSEIAYRMAKDQFERSSREIVDATVGGKLEVFRKVDYYSLFGEQSGA